MPAHEEVQTSHDWTRKRFLSEVGPTCSPDDCPKLAKHTSGKYWRVKARKGEIKAVKIGGLWFINSEALCDALGID